MLAGNAVLIYTFLFYFTTTPPVWILPYSTPIAHVEKIFLPLVLLAVAVACRKTVFGRKPSYLPLIFVVVALGVRIIRMIEVNSYLSDLSDLAESSDHKAVWNLVQQQEVLYSTINAVMSILLCVAVIALLWQLRKVNNNEKTDNASL